jgi:anionic cell wall polymer biosynthesis LytR-Cps2A-Psr (LCP) family protein
MRIARILAVVVAFVLGGCTGGGTDTSTTIGAGEGTTTTVAATTVTTMATTTAPPRMVTVTATDEAAAGLATAVAGLLSAAADSRNPAPDAADELVAHLSAAAIPDSVVISSAVTATLPEGEVVAVARTDAGDVLLGVDDGAGWRVVGADMESLGAEPWYGKSPHMVLVIGSDARPGGDEQRAHADSIHVVTALPAEGTGAILGWPRDSLVTTPYGDMKLTALMVRRGPEVMEEFFTEHWEMPVEGYVVTGFRGFENLVAQAFGRLTIDVPRGLPTQEWFDGFSAGEQSLPPIRVLDYSRTRKRVSGGDLTRSYNQGLVMLAALQTIQLVGVDALPGLLAVLTEHAYTNLSAEQLLQLGASAFAIDAGAIENQVLPGRVGVAVGASVVFLDPEADVMIDDLRQDGLLEPGQGHRPYGP